MRFTYDFFFENDRVETFDLSLDDCLDLEPLPSIKPPPWTRLTNRQCPGCPLREDESPHCPVARNLAIVIDRFKDDISYTKVKTRVTTDARISEKKGSLQECLSPLMGLIMATSGCPALEKLKPMAFTHLPFANDEETIFRAACTYLLGQYIRDSHGLAADWKLERFTAMYQTISNINSSFSERLREIIGRDANINALIILDTFAQTGCYAAIDDWIAKIEKYFKAYLTDR
jgi:hypothetical protein